MNVGTESGEAERRFSDRTSGPARVDPRVPRFGQAITATFLLGGVLLREPVLIYAIALLLVIPVVSRWRIDPYALLWRGVVRRFVDAPMETESATPHRFARVLGAIGSSLASALLLLTAVAPGTTVTTAIGYVIALAVGLLAALGASTGLCLGCKLYGQVSYLKRQGVL